MRLVEIRDLDGPNIFLLQPAIKVEFAFENDQDLIQAAGLLGTPESGSIAHPVDCFSISVNSWFKRHFDQVSTPPVIVVRTLETPQHIAVAFSWNHRRFSVAVAEALAAVATGSSESSAVDFRGIQDLQLTTNSDDLPAMIDNAERRMPVVGITGTNGKTTTTRLLAHIVMATGKQVGWSSSSGVYIDGREVLTGDYSGPSGARRVLIDPEVDLAILETARGGILLRGIAYESNDVSVFTNISADHLDLQGIHTVEGLAEVKSIVVRVTRPGGTAVLNADDALVMSSTQSIQIKKILFSRHLDSPVIDLHVATGGTAIVSDGRTISIHTGESAEVLVSLAEIPVTFGGRAPHMVENALAATGAAIALGLSHDEIASGLKSFRNSVDQNLGRLNVFEVGGVTIIMDYAHNEVGLGLLIDFAKTFMSASGSLLVVIGTAGDRTDQSLQEIGRVAADRADRVIVKDTKRFLRGRTNEDLIEMYQIGVRRTGRADAEVAPGELDGMLLALSDAKPGDVIAIMCQEQIDEICSWLKEHGTSVS